MFKITYKLNIKNPPTSIFKIIKKNVRTLQKNDLLFLLIM